MTTGDPLDPDHAFQRYLESKISVDDRALNKDVLTALRRALADAPTGRLSVLEIGGGIGTMLARLIEWRVLATADYELLDHDASLLARARPWLRAWAERNRLEAHERADQLSIQGDGIDVRVRFTQRDVSAAPGSASAKRDGRVDLLIANAVLDVVDVPSTLPGLFAELRPDGLFWFTINFDGETIFEPEHPDDAALLRVYHRSMDLRVRDGRPSGHSRTGRRLFQHIPAAGGTILAAGASDWVIHPVNGGYPAHEQAFLHHILDTIAAELERHGEVDRRALSDWLLARRRQVEAGTLVYLAHQLDFVGRR